MLKLKEMKPKQLRGLVKKQNKKLNVNLKRIESTLSRNNDLTRKLNVAKDNIVKQRSYIATANADSKNKDSQISILRKETLSLESKIKTLENEITQLNLGNITLETIINVQSSKSNKYNKLYNETVVICKYLESKLNLGKTPCTIK